MQDMLGHGTEGAGGHGTTDHAAISRRGFLYGATALPLVGYGQRAQAAVQGHLALDARTIHSGHSLTDPIVPMLDTLVSTVDPITSRGRVIDRSTIPGSPMDWRWDNRTAPMPDARDDIADYELLVITERVSLSGTKPWHNSEEMALRWFTHAWENGHGGAGAQTILYATWVQIDSGPDFENPFNDPEGHLLFRDRLPLEMARWQEILDHVNTNRPSGAPKMHMIPGPLIMAAAHDDVVAGNAPGVQGIDDLFSDDIHLNTAGAFLISLAHLAVIYGIDPRSVPGRMGRSGWPSEETADWMKTLVHEVLQDYPDSGYPARS